MVPNIKVGDYVKRVMWGSGGEWRRVIQVEDRKMWLEGKPVLSLNFYYIDPLELAGPNDTEVLIRYSWMVRGAEKGGFSKWIKTTT